MLNAGSPDADDQSLLRFMSFENGVACFRPVGNVALDKAVELVDFALRYCKEHEHDRLFADITGLTGFGPPSTSERFFIIGKWVDTAAGDVVLSLVLPPAIMDPEKIGVTMANNRGLCSNVFTDPDEALTWLVSDACS